MDRGRTGQGSSKPQKRGDPPPKPKLAKEREKSSKRPIRGKGFKKGKYDA